MQNTFGINSAKVDEFSAEEFINKNLRPFSAHSNVRGIPFIGDGFKQAQRKAMWGILKRGENAGLVSVERVSAAVASDTNYHHGIGSLQGTIIGLAQNFAGSNNVNLLVPEGQFGSRRSHGASAARYIETTLHENFRKLFKKDDDLILEQIDDGGILIEPKYFIPLLPVVLLNGAEGMGTGHATHIFAYAVEDIKRCVKDVVNGKSLAHHTLVPSWEDFTGTVDKNPATGQIKVTGVLKVENTTTIKITDLPVGTQSDPYEAYLFKLQDKGLIKSFVNASDDTGFEFIVTAPRTTTANTHADLLKMFKLESNDSENYTVWGPEGYIKKYESAEDLLTDFVAWRLARYEERRQKQIQVTQESIELQNEIIRFIEFYLDNAVKFKNIGKGEIVKILQDAKFIIYEKLLNMAIWTLTKDRIADINEKLVKEKEKLASLESTTNKAMYLKELSELKL